MRHTLNEKGNFLKASMSNHCNICNYDVGNTFAKSCDVCSCICRLFDGVICICLRTTQNSDALWRQWEEYNVRESSAGWRHRRSSSRSMIRTEKNLRL